MSADLPRIRDAFCRCTYRFTTSCAPKMQKQGITTRHIEEAICRDNPEVIEDYPDDARGPACLILGWADLVTPLHIVVGYASDPAIAVEVVTVYEPDNKQWYNNYRVRRNR